LLLPIFKKRSTYTDIKLDTSEVTWPLNDVVRWPVQ